MSNWFDEIVSKISHAGLKGCEIRLNGGRLLVAEKAGRILACEIDGVDENIFYLGGEVSAGYFNGGDRLWVAPEIGYYWPSIEKAREDAVKWAKTPEQVDPGHYKVVAEGDVHCCLRNEGIELVDGRNDRKVGFDLTRIVCQCDEPEGLPEGVSCASFSVTNEIEVKHGDEGATVGAWDILQVPPRGTLICPLVKPIDSPTSYYDDFGDVHVQWDEHSVRYLIDAGRRTKMGLPPEVTNGRMGFYREVSDDKAVMIVRIFAPLAGLPYVDQPIWQDKEQVAGGDVLQAYNDDGSYGPFGEMEYHDPGVVIGSSPMRRNGTSVTHVLSGEPLHVKKAGKMLLGCEVKPIE
ncbi:hypothetical protein JD969_01305 [Planctomycetota bacterium]|nr:hypothetical protein JD969_01305 [Planctomycetota bacterium]